MEVGVGLLNQSTTDWRLEFLPEIGKWRWNHARNGNETTPPKFQNEGIKLTAHFSRNSVSRLSSLRPPRNLSDLQMDLWILPDLLSLDRQNLGSRIGDPDPVSGLMTLLLSILSIHALA